MEQQSWAATPGRVPIGAQHGRKIHSAETRVISEHNAQPPPAPRAPPNSPSCVQPGHACIGS